MSSFILYTDRENAVVAMDTLAVKPDGSPLTLCSKAVYLPHLKTIVAGTGVGSFANNWANSVNNDVYVTGVMNLDYHTPAALRKRWQEYSSVPDFPANMTTTVYQVGVAEDSGEIRAFAYRSTNNFVSEPLDYGTRIKPEASVPFGESLIESLRPIMESQREVQKSKPSSERLYIGGECIAMHLTPQACRIFTVFKFDDYEDLRRDILSNFNN